MLAPRVRSALIVLAASAGLGGCTTYGLGAGYGDPYYGGYGNYGYGYDDRYYDPYAYGSRYYGSRYAYGTPYYGWYDGFYYPGTGYYVYDLAGNRARWNEAQRAYWSSRVRAVRNNTRLLENWTAYRADRQSDRRVYRVERRSDRQAVRSGTITREQYRADRRQDRKEARQERRSDRQQLRRANREDLRVTRKNRRDD